MIFTGHICKPRVSKHWRKPVGLEHKFESYKDYSSVLQ